MRLRFFATAVEVSAHCVLWTDYFKAPHFEKYPQLHTLFNEATKAAGAAGTKGSWDLAKADELLAKIDQIAEIFWETKKA